MKFRSRKQQVCFWYGVVCTLSALAYAAGLPMWWTALPEVQFGFVWRGMALVVIHAVGILAGVLSLDNGNWDWDVPPAK